jgi:hypothetical protein
VNPCNLTPLIAKIRARAEKFVEEIVERALEVGDGNLGVDAVTFELVEDG